MRSGRLFHYILLASVLFNLGDAPYLDEIFAELEQQRQTALATNADETDPALPKPAGTPKTAGCGYQLLLSMDAISAERMTLPTARTAKVFPQQEFLFLCSVPLDRIDRPPA
jgi:hypothetical protein